ncbi:DUF1214 domain-containing protein [Vibrio lamellibrachiae]|uniref:DUF1214 domain-containing protein n=1 Tax=Vibrio lamellibrachiae TaxID=2910253 RepID=UPI003D09F662
MKRLLLAALALSPTAFASTQYTEVPDNITTPDEVITSVGTFHFTDGNPDRITVERAYELLGIQRASQVFLEHIPSASIYSMMEGFKNMGQVEPNQVLLLEDLMDAKNIFLTGNADTVYFFAQYNVEQSPVELTIPPNTLGMFNDARFQWMEDAGRSGPDRGKGGVYVVVPRNIDLAERTQLANHYGESYVITSPSNNFAFISRGFKDPQSGEHQTAVENIKTHFKARYVNAEQKPMQFINPNGVSVSTIHANDEHFYVELNEVIQREPKELYSAHERGVMEHIGIVKGEPMDQEKVDLVQAAAVANAQARSLTLRPHSDFFQYEGNPQWHIPFNRNPSHDYMSKKGNKDFDAQVYFHYPATAVTPAMALDLIGIGSKYAFATYDHNGDNFDGGEHYAVTIPANVPAKDFWSFVIYDIQTRSMLQNPINKPGVDGFVAQPNDDGSYTVHFAPIQPEGVNEGNWIQTIPNKSWMILFRTYGPLEPWFDKTWRLGDIVKQ